MLRIILYYFFEVLYFAILAYCIGSWFVKPGTKFFELWMKLRYFLDPLFYPARFILSKIKFLRTVPVDFTPWLTVILLNFVYRLFMLIL